MLITDKKELEKYTTEKRLWQGIPGIEVTKKGRIFAAFYSGGVEEELENYAALIKSDDGVNFSEPIAVVFLEEHRCYDECLWIDPLDRLWFIWSVMPNHAVYAVICDQPDEEELAWGKPFLIGHDVLLNKPIVLSSGEWLFPVAVWGENVWEWLPERRTKQTDMRAFVYRSADQGKTFERLGGVDMPGRAHDEHMVVERADSSLMMFVKTQYGIGVSYSYDKGMTWSDGKDSGIAGPNARFHIKRLKSGRILLVNHYEFQGRNNLTALLSEDEGRTWKYKLLLDERNNVSYPDAAEDDEGNIYIIYDRERGVAKKNLKEVYECAREILYAKIREADIIAGAPVCPDSKLKCVITKLSEYEGEPLDFSNRKRYREIALYLADGNREEIIDRAYRYFLKRGSLELTKEEYMKLRELQNTEKDNVSLALEAVRLYMNC